MGGKKEKEVHAHVLYCRIMYILNMNQEAYNVCCSDSKWLYPDYVITHSHAHAHTHTNIPLNDRLLTMRELSLVEVACNPVLILPNVFVTFFNGQDFLHYSITPLL